MKIITGTIVFTFTYMFFLLFICCSKNKSDQTKVLLEPNDTFKSNLDSNKHLSSTNVSVKDSNVMNRLTDKKVVKKKVLSHENMMKIPGGTFKMGSIDGESDESPVHQVAVMGFYMDKTEITQSEYEKIAGKNPSVFTDCPSCPVESVSWDEANDYCQNIGKRLPTEAEWEYAARAGTSTKYYWGNEMDDDYAWFDGNSNSSTQPVGKKKPNKWGLYDMSGNVREWCNDWYEPYTMDYNLNQQAPSFGGSRICEVGPGVLVTRVFAQHFVVGMIQRSVTAIMDFAVFLQSSCCLHINVIS